MAHSRTNDPATPVKFEHMIFYALIALYAEYCILFIINTSFIVNGVRYFCLLDDAMISMRYAKNFAHGHGLVWNIGGQPVEGYTNFLWVLIMAMFHLLPIPPEKMSLAVQLLGMVIVCGNLFVVRRIALRLSDSAWVSIGSVVLTALYYPINNWTLRGMEVGALLLIVNLVLWNVLVTMEGEKLPTFTLVVMAIGILIRTDIVVVFGGILLAVTVLQHRSRKPIEWRGYIIVGLTLIGHTLFRFFYYGEPLPNTYYLKMTGVPLALRLHDGAVRLWDFMCDASVFFFLVPLLLLFIYPSKRRIINLLLLTFCLQCAYSLFVGGDIFDAFLIANRYLSIVMPIFFILVSWAFFALLDNLRFALVIQTRRSQWDLKGLLYGSLIVFTLYSFNERQIYCAAILAPALEVSKDEWRVSMALAVKKSTTSDATIAVASAGSIPYFTERRAIDILGKNDRYIAHLDARVTEEFLPGHNKWDYNYSIKSLSPDVIVELWKNREEIQRYVEQNYTTVRVNERSLLYYRTSSPYVTTDVITKGR